MASKGNSIVLSTHVIEEAESICHRIGIMSNGKLIVEGTVKELQDRASASGKGLEEMFLSLTGDELHVAAAKKKFNEMKERQHGVDE
jgi:ABC-2 type transport system ATP-binding protein